MKNYGIIFAIVTELIAVILLGLFVGRWLDEKYSKEGLFLICGVLLGSVLGLTRLVIRMRKLMDD